MFDSVGLSDGEGVVPGLTLTLANEERSGLVPHLQQLLLRVGSLYTTEIPTAGRERGGEGRGGGRRRHTLIYVHGVHALCRAI